MCCLCHWKKVLQNFSVLTEKIFWHFILYFEIILWKIRLWKEKIYFLFSSGNSRRHSCHRGHSGHSVLKAPVLGLNGVLYCVSPAHTLYIYIIIIIVIVSFSFCRLFMLCCIMFPVLDTGVLLWRTGWGHWGCDCFTQPPRWPLIFNQWDVEMLNSDYFHSQYCLLFKKLYKQLSC